MNITYSREAVYRFLYEMRVEHPNTYYSPKELEPFAETRGSSPPFFPAAWNSVISSGTASITNSRLRA